MGYGQFTPARRSRLALAVLCLAGALAGCSRTYPVRSNEPPAILLTIVSQHDFRGNLLSGG